mgnify:CR=1 FL=1
MASLKKVLATLVAGALARSHPAFGTFFQHSQGTMAQSHHNQTTERFQTHALSI